MEDNKSQRQLPHALVTGASGMLGGYVCRLLNGDFHIDTLGRAASNTISCDLTAAIPELGGRTYDLVVHCAGSEDDAHADLNSTGTQNLLAALSGNPPRRLVYVSSASVYGEEGENLDEATVPAPASPAARAKEKGEREAARWAAQCGTLLTIVRPARMFGNGVAGETLRIFNDALSGSFIHIRGNDARTSIVCALDVARAIIAVSHTGGTFNLADGRNPRFIDMVQAMTANAGREQRITTLPAAWAGWLWRICRLIPAIDRNLSPAVAARRMKSLTINQTKAAEAGITFHNTIEVIARRDPDYPYDRI